MLIEHKALPLDAVKSTCWGILWTSRGIQIVRPGDMIVVAKTGCTWRIPESIYEACYRRATLVL